MVIDPAAAIKGTGTSATSTLEVAASENVAATGLADADGAALDACDVCWPAVSPSVAHPDVTPRSAIAQQPTATRFRIHPPLSADVSAA